VVRNGSLRDLEHAVDSLVSGESWVDPKATRLLLEKVREREVSRQKEKHGNLNGLRDEYELKPKEVEVLKGLLAAEKYVEIAGRIGKSVDTVRYYVKILYRKLGVNSRSELYLLSTQKQTEASS
jgi:DNA-binding NarL/FixJ family response regulator